MTWAVWAFVAEDVGKVGGMDGEVLVWMRVGYAVPVVVGGALGFFVSVLVYVVV